MADALALPGLRQMVRDANSLVAGATSTLTDDDIGLYGPGSITWRLRQDATYNVAGLRALLIQALHPVAMAAVEEHSTYREDAWLRAERTTRYQLTTTFSSTRTAETAATAVRRVHARISGVDPTTGRSYRADDQDLLLWVHNAQVDSELATWNTFHRPLDTADADRFIEEQVASAALIGIDPRSVPTTYTDLADYMSAAPTQMTPAAKAFGQSLLTATMPLTVRPLWFQHLAATVTTLPEHIRDQYGFPRWLPTGALSRAAQRLNFRATQQAFGALPGVRASRRTLRRIEAAAMEQT
jgi:uncharacterized protein (DUF2236 family)